MLMMTPAFVLLHSFLGDPVRAAAGYKAPHAPRGTPPRLHRRRVRRYVYSPTTGQEIAVRRPFVGHRP